MKRLYVLMIFLLPALLSAQTKSLELNINYKTFSDKEMKLTLQYPKKGWNDFSKKDFLHTKKIYKDVALIKKTASLAHVRVHVILLKNKENFLIKINKFWADLLREKIGSKSRSYGYRKLTSQESKNFNCDWGVIRKFEYRDRHHFDNRGMLYGLLKGNKVYIIEAYYEIPEILVQNRQNKRNVVTKDQKLLEKIISTIRIQ